MAAGDFCIRMNPDDSSTVPDAGSNLDPSYTNEYFNTGSIVTYTSPNFQVDTGLYLIMYSEFFETADETNNERISIRGEIQVSGTGAVGGYSHGYIRKFDNDQEVNLFGAHILDVTSDNTDIFIRYYREDDSTTGTCNRDPHRGGVQILELDDNHNYGFYSTSSTETNSGATERVLNLDTNDRQDTGFSRTGAQITVPAAGRYVALYNIDFDTAFVDDRCELTSRIYDANAGAELPGTRGYAYSRGVDNTEDTAICWIGLLDLDGTEDLEVRWQRNSQNAGGQTFTAAAGATFQLWQLPSGNKTCLMTGTTTDVNANDPLTFDTVTHNDSDTFTATASSDHITVDQRDYCLVFASHSQDTEGSDERMCPFFYITRNEHKLPYANSSTYHRRSGDTGAGLSADNVGAIVPIFRPGSEIGCFTRRYSSSGTLAAADGQLAVISLESVFGVQPDLLYGYGHVKHYDGAEWPSAPVKRYDGTDWIDKPMKHYGGSTWDQYGDFGDLIKYTKPHMYYPMDSTNVTGGYCYDVMSGFALKEVTNGTPVSGGYIVQSTGGPIDNGPYTEFTGDHTIYRDESDGVCFRANCTNGTFDNHGECTIMAFVNADSYATSFPNVSKIAGFELFNSSMLGIWWDGYGGGAEGQHIFSRADPGNGSSYNCSYRGSGGTVALANSTWHMVFGRHTSDGAGGTDITGWSNGALQETLNVPSPERFGTWNNEIRGNSFSIGGSTALGSDSGANSSLFDGGIAHVAVWARALTDAEIKGLFALAGYLDEA